MVESWQLSGDVVLNARRDQDKDYFSISSSRRVAYNQYDLDCQKLFDISDFVQQ